jgi:flavodoxin
VKVLIVYASNSGNTLMVANRIAEGLTGAGHQPTIQNAAATSPEDLADYDLILFGSCTWLLGPPEGPQEGQLQRQWFSLAAKLREGPRYDGKLFAVFALGRREYTKFCGAADELEQLVADLGGRLATKSFRLHGFPHHQLETVDGWTIQLLNDLKGVAAPT